MKIYVSVAVLVCCLLWSRRGMSQGQLEFKGPQSTDTMKLVHILNAESYRGQQLDSGASLTTLVGNVRLKQDNTIIYCDSLISSSKTNLIESFGHVHIHDDSTDIYSDYMKYMVDTKKVYFEKSVKLTDGKGVLTTEAMNYDLNTHIGIYNNGGKIVNNGSVLTSQEGTYYGESKDVYFKRNVVLRDPQYDLSADSLLYNTQTQISTFITETFILFKDTTHRSVRTKDGYYDLRNKKAFFGKRPIITDGTQQLTGDEVNIDDSTGISLATGHAVYKDTAQGIAIIANYMYSDKKKNTFFATQKPLMILKQEKDSIYITADTLFSGRLIDAQANAKRISRADSLHRRYVDSLFKEQSDSSRHAQTDSVTETDSLPLKGKYAKLPILLKDESHPQTSPVIDSSEVRPDSTLAGKMPQAVIARNEAARLKDRNTFPVTDSSTARARRPTFFAPRKKVSAEDTVATGPIDSTLRYIQGYHHVRIFSDSLQAVSDSLYYSGKDSIFRLYTNPIAWGSGHYQVTGDTMFVYTKNKKANRLYVFENAMTINKVGTNFYNQIKGTTINVYFTNGEVDYMRAKGNAESIYYVQDDNKAYTGVNKAHADIIDMIFEKKEKDKGKELNRVVLRNDAEGSMIPFKKVNFDDMRLRGFKWQEDKRPKTKYELFE